MIWEILELEEDIMVFNNETKFHRVIMETIHLRKQASFQSMIFHKLRGITP